MQGLFSRLPGGGHRNGSIPSQVDSAHNLSVCANAIVFTCWADIETVVMLAVLTPVSLASFGVDCVCRLNPLNSRCVREGSDSQFAAMYDPQAATIQSPMNNENRSFIVLILLSQPRDWDSRPLLYYRLLSSK